MLPNKKNAIPSLLLLLILLFSSCSQSQQQFISIEDGHFSLDGQVYRFIGVNYWYGMFLAANKSPLAQQRLIKELDELERIGVKNIRVMASAEGPDNQPWRVQPALQNQPGILNEDLLQGLDRLIVACKKRGISLTLVLNNFFQWSGGMAQYVSWADSSNIPYPHHPDYTWDDFQHYSASFYQNEKAKGLFVDFLDQLIKRTNSINKIAYIDDPTIMSWQIANEPRGMQVPEAYLQWVSETADYLQSQIPNQLISLGGEGYTANDYAATRFECILEIPSLDYLTAHIWIENWGWYDPKDPSGTYETAKKQAIQYAREHVLLANELQKPIVFEEFGISRDQGSHRSHDPILHRNDYFESMFQVFLNHFQAGHHLGGLNLWAYSGQGIPKKPGSFWEQGHPLTGDPPHETQGWYSIYSTDTSTLNLIKEYNQKLAMLQ